MKSLSLCGFRPLCPILGTALFAVRNSHGIQRAPYNMITHAGKVLDPASAYEHYGMLLKIMPDARNVRGHLHAVCEPDSGHFPEGRVGLTNGVVV